MWVDISDSWERSNIIISLYSSLVLGCIRCGLAVGYISSCSVMELHWQDGQVAVEAHGCTTRLDPVDGSWYLQVQVPANGSCI